MRGCSAHAFSIAQKENISRTIFEKISLRDFGLDQAPHHIPVLSLADTGTDRTMFGLSAVVQSEVGMQMANTRENRATKDDLDLIDRYWRAANYLSVGQIYLLDNPLLKEKLRPEHIKPRLLGHWGTTPGLNFIYAHLNRAIRASDLNVIYVCGPGHGGPGMVANTYLEGSYSEIYPDITRDADGLRKLFRQFSFPGGIPSHAAPETPGSIHEGGELGYAWCMPMARRSTIPISSSPAWSATAKPKPVRWQPPGTPPNS
jgi:XFP N-terminal domain